MDMLPYIKNSIAKSNQYLLAGQKYWDINAYADDPKIKALKNAPDIFNFVSNSLSYNYSRVAKNLTRLGAEKILDDPRNAVCMEFTDLFVAIAREKGIYSREIEGYGFTDDQKLRPLSLTTDILHAWPEYYNKLSNMWIPTDPTWQNTSGIDYFSSLDLNHIVLAIHGKSSTYPYPAGTYKSDNSKDVIVTVADKKIASHPKLEVSKSLPQTIIEGKKYKETIVFKNTGNVFLKNKTIEIDSPDISFTPQTVSIDLIAPMSEKKITVEYSLKLNYNRQAKDAVVTFHGDDILITQNIQIIHKSLFIVFVSGAILIILAIIVGLTLALKDRRHDI
jgi:hypothetical protein